ncbi:MAG: hypothetical protein HYX92_12275 [Chloroflexi bacterium]|nr:hypothetical protein [Chloroflexota bacterium]
MVYKVLSPLGEPIVKQAGGAPRLLDLNGKTVCEIWNGLFRGHVTFPLIRELLQKHYPDVHVIAYSEFPVQDIRGSTSDLQGRVDATVALAIEKGCDALIVAHGG